jgi:hypothetical protein
MTNRVAIVTGSAHVIGRGIATSSVRAAGPMSTRHGSSTCRRSPASTSG